MVKSVGISGLILVVLVNGCPKGPPRAVTEHGDFKLTLLTDQRTYAQGETAEFTLRIEHTGAEATQVMYTSGQSFDVQVTRDGETVWQWAHGRFFTMAIRTVPVPVGWTDEFTMTWNLTDNDGKPAQAGEYQVHAVWTVRDRVQTEPVTIRIE